MESVTKTIYHDRCINNLQYDLGTIKQNENVQLELIFLLVTIK